MKRLRVYFINVTSSPPYLNVQKSSRGFILKIELGFPHAVASSWRLNIFVV